jgi:hypothetical protein
MSKVIGPDVNAEKTKDIGLFNEYINDNREIRTVRKRLYVLLCSTVQFNTQ